VITLSGKYSNWRFTLENYEKVSSVSMRSVRNEAAAAQLQDGNFLITSGKDGSLSLLSTVQKC
jgi:hypothetical protein